MDLKLSLKNCKNILTTSVFFEHLMYKVDMWIVYSLHLISVFLRRGNTLNRSKTLMYCRLWSWLEILIKDGRGQGRIDTATRTFLIRHAAVVALKVLHMINSLHMINAFSLCENAFIKCKEFEWHILDVLLCKQRDNTLCGKKLFKLNKNNLLKVWDLECPHSFSAS